MRDYLYNVCQTCNCLEENWRRAFHSSDSAWVVRLGLPWLERSALQDIVVAVAVLANSAVWNLAVEQTPPMSQSQEAASLVAAVAG